MLKIALTGGVASGKSSVAQLFREAGVAVIDADEVARQVVQPHQPAYTAIVAAFGKEYVAPDGSLDRHKLAQRVFSHPPEIARLNQLVHPWIAQAVQERLKELRAQGCPMVVVEVPLLFEMGLAAAFDRIIVVYADEEIQRQRLAQRDRRDAREIEGILAAQLPLASKVARADYVVDNGGPLAATATQVRNIISELQKLLDKRGEKD